MPHRQTLAFKQERPCPACPCPAPGTATTACPTFHKPCYVTASQVSSSGRLQDEGLSGVKEINEDFVTESCSKHFLEVLKKNQRLRELHLFFYRLDERVEEMLIEGLQHPDCKIEKLSLEGQFLRDPFSRSFAEIFRKNHRFRELDGEVATVLYAEFKHRDCKIEKLGMINAESFKKHWRKHIVQIVKISQKLRELYLQDDHISDSEMKLLLEEVKHSKHKLKELWLSGKHIVQNGEWMETEHAARASSSKAFSCLLI
ncbi:NACHT, LRR and PYD domains-containing protein 12-like [Vipera latastei]